MDALSLLLSLDLPSLLLIFWYTTLLEIPRYVIAGAVLGVEFVFARFDKVSETAFTVSIVVAAHNEARPLRHCIGSLSEQTIAREPKRMQVVVVDDGSTDNLFQVARELQRDGAIDTVLRLDRRGGKSAAVNLGLANCTGDIVVIIDVDTTLDRDALAAVLPYFSNPRVGAVGGNLGVRNCFASPIAACQAIEYAIAISLGRRIADMLGILSIISGAFGAFRRSALESVGGLEVEASEDADLTMKLRRAGWDIRFAPEAYALTVVPETTPALIAQRLRWDRALIPIWIRKYGHVLDPRQPTFRITDALTVLDLMVFNVMLSLLLPAYLLWLVHQFGLFTATILAAIVAGYIVLDAAALAAATVLGTRLSGRLLMYLPAYTAVQLLVLRPTRIFAIIQEMVFRSSKRDPFLPREILRQADET